MRDFSIISNWNLKGIRIEENLSNYEKARNGMPQIGEIEGRRGGGRG